MRYSITAALAIAIIPALGLPVHAPASRGVGKQACQPGAINSMVLNLGKKSIKSRDDKKKGEKEAKDEEDKKNEKDLTGTFGTPVPLAGGDLKQDTSFKATVGDFELEFSAKDARTLTVTENKAPAAPPAGFKALEPSSFIVKMAEGGDKLTFGGIDYIFDPANAALKDVDLSKAQVGKLDAATKAFVIDKTLGELEFEDEENEIAFKNVKDVNGEWGIFVPTAAGEAPAGGDKKEEDDKAGQVEVAAVFGTDNNVKANEFTNLNFPKNAAGALEVEIKGAAANTVFVAPAMFALLPPPGHVYVDPLTFSVSTTSPPAAGDTHKIDYIFTDTVKGAMDVSKVVPGKLDAATGQWITTGLGEFEFEEEENEWSLKVADANGVWAMFAPDAAVKANQ